MSQEYDETTVFKNFQSLKEYTQTLRETYPKFLTTMGVSMSSSSLYSNYIMMDAQNNIRSLHVTHDGHQEWKALDVEAAKQRLNTAYFSQYIKEWGLDTKDQSTDKKGKFLGGKKFVPKSKDDKKKDKDIER